MLRPYRLGLCLLACLLFVPQAGATDRASQRGQFRAALAAAARPPEGAWKKLAAGLDAQRYPLYPYIELAALRPHLAKLDQADVERFLERWPDTLPAQELREAWLRELARRGDWKAFRADWAPSEDRELQCDALLARLAGGSRLDYAKDIEGIWSGERSLPDSCNAVLRAARVDGIVTDPIVWEHLIRAADSGSASAAGDAAALLSGSERIAADRIVAALRDPRATLAKAKAWADEPRARDAMSYGFARLARRDSDAAETQWAELEARFKWDATQKNRVLNAIALYRATSYSPDALARLKALPAAADDEATREWRVRVALADSDWAATLAALERLSDVQKADARWRYLRARVLAKLGRDAESASLMAEVAREANFHGFLAADWSGRPYSICPNTLAGDAEAVAALAQQPDLERAYEFRELGMLPEARREWKFAMGKLDEGQRRLAADGAYRKGWYDRAVFAFSGDPDTQRLYEQRFPLGMQSAVKREAAGAGIDPAWAYAIIRAESAWMSDAHSHADAYGLMQLLPGVAKKLAKAEKLPYERARDLFDPALNVQLGTRFLGRMAAAYDGSPWLASAAYNAGQAPVGRWLEARGTLEPDFFIETIPYKETREYVARVLAFSVIYDWRMNGKVLALSARMPKIGQPYRAPTDATPRKTIVCATTAVERKPSVDAPASEAPTPEAGGDEPAAAPPLPSSPAH